MDVKGTLVGETRPTVRNGAKMRDEFEVGLAEAATDKTFWRFDKGPSGFE